MEKKDYFLLKDVKMRKQIEEKVTEIVDVGAPNLWGHLKDGVLEGCDEVCGKKRGRISKGEFQERKKHTRQCVKTVQRIIIRGMKAC